MLLSDRAVRTIVIAFPFLILGLFVCLFAGLRCYCFVGFKPVAFEESTWKAADREQRGHMADDVVDRKILMGRTADEVCEILGDPDDNQHFNQQHRFRYHLGHRGRNPNCPVPLTEYSLLVLFDPRESVHSVCIAD